MSEKAHEPGKVSGIKLNFGGQDYIVPPLNIEGVERHEQDIQRVQTDPNLSMMDKVNLICGVVLTAVQRNYPSVDLVFIKKWIDLGNVEEVFQAVMAQSGYKEGKPGE
jgi:hypothetical protein